MAVLVEGNAVVVRLSVLAGYWGEGAVERLSCLLPPHCLCMDSELAALWCASAEAASALASQLEPPHASPHAAHALPGGPPPDWLELTRPALAAGVEVTVAQLRGGLEARIFAPPGWRPPHRESRWRDGPTSVEATAARSDRRLARYRPEAGEQE